MYRLGERVDKGHEAQGWWMRLKRVGVNPEPSTVRRLMPFGPRHGWRLDVTPSSTTSCAIGASPTPSPRRRGPLPHPRRRSRSGRCHGIRLASPLRPSFQNATSRGPRTRSSPCAIHARGRRGVQLVWHAHAPCRRPSSAGRPLGGVSGAALMAPACHVPSLFLTFVSGKRHALTGCHTPETLSGLAPGLV